MLQRKTLGSVVLLGLLVAGTANADGYRSEPQVRFGIDILWGGYGSGYYPAPPPVVVYPPHYGPPRGYVGGYGRGYERGYERGYDRGYGRAKWKGNGHRKHRHRSHRGHDHDD